MFERVRYQEIHFLFLKILYFLNCESMTTHLQETWKIQNKIHIVPLYIIIIFWVGKLRFLAGVSISGSQKLIEWTDRKVEGYSRPESTINQFNIIKTYTVKECIFLKEQLLTLLDIG